MLRQIIKPAKRQLTIKIPEEYINRKIEILVLPLFEMDSFVENEKPGDKEDLRRPFQRASKITIDEEADIEGVKDEVNEVVLRYQHISPLDY